ncbi:MAG: type II toxin-antitoxin system YafQ family toxin [Pseudomonadota bacterium]
MLIPVYKNKFAKDVKRLKKRGKDLIKLKHVADELINGNVLDKKYLNHLLKGEYTDCHECHLEPDWLLIYKIENLHIIFLRSGSHSDLFSK